MTHDELKMSQMHVFSQSSQDGRASRGPILSHRLLQRLPSKATAGEIPERQSCASSNVRRTTLVFPHILEGYTCFLVCSGYWVYCWKSLKKTVFHWGHTESGAADMVDGARVQLPACPLTLLDTLTYLAVSEHLTTYTAQELPCEPYLMYTFGILQPGTVHFLHIVRTSPTKKWFSSYRCRIAPNLLKRPNCCWFVLWKCLNSLGGRQWPQLSSTSP